MEEPIQLTTFGSPKLTSVTTDAKANGIDTKLLTSQVDTEANNNRVDPLTDGSLELNIKDSAQERECNSVPHETAVVIPEPPPPPAIQLSSSTPPSTTSAVTVGTLATAEIIDNEPVSVKPDADSISKVTDEPIGDVTLTAAPVTAESPVIEESNSLVHEKEAFSPPIQLTTFGKPLSPINETPENVKYDKNDQVAKPTEVQTTHTAVETTTTLCANTDSKPSTDQAPEPDDPAAVKNGAGVDTTALLSTEIELGPAELTPEPVVLTDEAAECHSDTSGMKLASLNSELNTMFVKSGDTERRLSQTRVMVLCTMAVATVMLIVVVVGLVLLTTYKDVFAIPGLSTSLQRVKGEVKIVNLLFNPQYQIGTSDGYKSLQRNFIQSIDNHFGGSTYSNIYRSTRVEQVRNGSVIVVFSVRLKPMKKLQSSMDVKSEREIYKRAKEFLKTDFRSVEINLRTYNVSWIKLELLFGSELFTEEPYTTPHVTTARIQIYPMTTPVTSTTAGDQSTTTTQTAVPPATTGVTITTSNQAVTTKASTSAAPETMTMMKVSNSTTGTTTVSTTNWSETVTSVTTTLSPSTYAIVNDTLTDANTTEMVTPTANYTTRRRRSTRFTKAWTSNLFTTWRSTSLPTETPIATVDVVAECRPNALEACVLRGWSTNVTRSPNRFGLKSSVVSQIWNQFIELTEATAGNNMTWRVICSLLAPSCDGRLVGPTLPCRSACLAAVRSMKDTVEARTMGALCNESLPESDSETICFKSSYQDGYYAPLPENPCHDQLCLNGGSCFAINDEWFCRCPESFGGGRCEIDPCNPNPCQNGATCHSHAFSVIVYVCACPESFHGRHCELSTGVSYLPTTQQAVRAPVEINQTECSQLLPYNASFSDRKVPDWRVLAPYASCSDDARLIFCFMAFPEFTLPGSQPRSPCKALCERVFNECDAFFSMLGWDFPGICEMLGTIPIAVNNFCTRSYP
ncbi:uncharacterized protein LOC110978325 isoform X2 [Acanthaster planci]|uniref:Uncharacterized protein LOC110978325 isoform X2 n=1 Tax=Acanthaster planci TaxID=133434 RepID=A0A8B7Y997_ACAPL|nr:uncharacterized protein LOC110978325 isoform X2 [Acanthaster planci]